MNKEISKILIAGTEYDIRDSRFDEASQAETARQEAETARQEAEQGRVTAEQQRADAEAARAEEFATFEGKIKVGEYAFDTQNVFDLNNESAPVNPSSFIKGIKIEVLDESLLQKDNSNVNVFLGYCGKGSDYFQIGTYINGLSSNQQIIGESARFPIPVDDLTVQTITNSAVRVTYLLYKPSFLQVGNYTYTSDNSKFAKHIILPQIKQKAYIPNIYVKAGLQPIVQGVYLENMVRYFQIDNYEFIANGKILKLRINHFSYNVSTKTLYVSYKIVSLNEDGSESVLREISGANEYTKKQADENGVVYYEFTHSSGVSIKAVYDVSGLPNIERDCTLKNGEFSEFVTLNSTIVNSEDVSIINYIKNRSTENCVPHMYQTLEWNSKTPKCNVAMACDFHNESECFNDLCHWSEDNAISKALTVICVAGDYISNGTAYTKAQWISNAKKVINAASNANLPILFCQGNHDKNWEQAGINASLVMTDAEVRSYIYNPAYELMNQADKNNFHFPTNGDDDALYYYFDKSVNGRVFRFIVINEYDLPETINEKGYRKYSGTDDYSGNVDVTFATYMSELQMRFVCDTLTNTPDNYVVFIVKHTPGGDTPLANYHLALRGVIAAYKNKTTIEAQVEAIDDCQSYTISCDFSGKQESHIVVLNGHHHGTFIGNDVNYSTTRIQGTALGTAGNNARVLGSVTESNCDVLTINTDTLETYLVRYGVAGNTDKSSYFGNENSIVI